MLNKKKSKPLDYNVSGKISDDDFIRMNKEAADEIVELQIDVSEIEGQLNSREEYKKQIDIIRRVLQNAENDAQNGIINKEFINKYIDKIFVTPEADDLMRLNIKIFTGETTDKFLEKLKSRTGHTFKKMNGAFASAVFVIRTAEKFLIAF